MMSPWFVPASPQAAGHARIAKAHFQAGRYLDAICEFEQAYDLEPWPSILFDLGRACELAGERERAIDYYRRWLSLDDL
jgi:tetratricopeptide (TPR) repeat protein